MRPSTSKRVLRTATGCTFALGVSLLCSGAAHAENYSETSVQLAYAGTDKQDFVMGTGSERGGRSTLRIEHFGTYALGQNYFTFDTYTGKDIGQSGHNRANFLIWNTHVMFSKVTGQALDLGPIRDVALMGRLEDGSIDSYRAGGIGLGVFWHLPVKGAVLETTVVQRRQVFEGGARSRPYLRTFFNIPFEVAGHNAYVSAPINLRRADRGGIDLYTEPELFVSFGPKDVYAIGVRVEHHRVTGANRLNTFGDRSRTTTNVALKWNW